MVSPVIRRLETMPLLQHIRRIAITFNNNFVTAAVPTVLPNSNVQWESQVQYNIGLDASVFDRFMDLTVDLYQKNTEDMLVPQSVPVTSDTPDIFVPYINAGEIRNRGVRSIANYLQFQ
ncbi:TonB-dependent receptor domain-containing protein (plasmid) [Tenacibaculum sp. ZS6-P6]|uniref:TonB-dependent receptor domain-containing protein n=1 Tax=Tenacibaculum sp. ZS6-P6 TaxID=3447503 RepID=UPI003F958607